MARTILSKSWFLCLSFLCCGIVLNVTANQFVSSKVFVNFPSSFNSPVQVQKVFDSESGRVEIISNTAQIKTLDDLEHYRQIEVDVEKAKHGAMLRDLGNMVDTINDNKEVDVKITMRQPRFQYLDKTKHSEEELRANSLAASILRPIKTTGSLLGQYNLSPSIIGNQDDNVINCKLQRKDLQRLAFDSGVACISQYIEAKPCALTPFSNFATSAFNPPPMPGYAQGVAVNAATFESGVWNHVVSCRNLVPSRIYSIPDTYYDGPPYYSYFHSNLTFTCLANAAPMANLWHYYGSDFGSTPADAGYTWIVNNGIQTLSCSMENWGDCNYADMVCMDDMAYRYPFPVFCNPTANGDHGTIANWQCYNAISVGNVQHLNQTTYQLNGCTQTQNPLPKYGPPINSTGSGDREMPYVVAPGIHPDADSEPDNCIDWVLALPSTQPPVNPPHDWPSCGTSFSAPICNGIAADVISANFGIFWGWPEATRMAIMLTAQNVDGGYWNCNIDGADGCGVVSGQSAATYATSCTKVNVNNSPVQNGCSTGLIYPGNYTALTYYISIPSSMPSGKHLRIVLTWDSNPDITTGHYVNSLDDLDIVLFDRYNNQVGWSQSWDGNVEVIDIPRTNLAPGTTYHVTTYKSFLRIPAGARGQYTPYAIGWTWVKDHAA